MAAPDNLHSRVVAWLKVVLPLEDFAIALAHEIGANPEKVQQTFDKMIEGLEKDRFDVVLMDVMMPVMDGITALKLLREREGERGQRTRVLMVTAHAMTGDRERFLGAGADGYVSKPMSQAALQKEIERVLNVPHADEDEAPN